VRVNEDGCSSACFVVNADADSMAVATRRGSINDTTDHKLGARYGFVDES
jgi:hypothetical protein